MTKTKDVTVVLDEHCAGGTSAGIQAGHSNEAEIVPSTSFILMDAANNLNVQDFTLNNIKHYALQKFNKDITKNIFDNLKPITRSEIRAEQRRIDASKQAKLKCMQKDSTKAKRKLEPTFGSPFGGIKKKNIAPKKITPGLLRDQELPIVQKEASDNVTNAENESKMAKTERSKVKESLRKIPKNAIISSKKVKLKSQVRGIKKKSVDHMNIPLSSLEKTESQHVQEKQDDEIAENPENETKMKVVKAKARPKQNVRNATISSKKVKSKRQVDHVNTPFSSLEKIESEHIQKEQVGDNVGNPENESKMEEVVKSKAKRRLKKNL